ncbi:MAG: hypothetical protein ACFB0G_21080 [Leptolyngbyaceae cyanobacterium]
MTKNAYCFCTAVYGSQYLKLARFLAEDLCKFSPDSKLIIVTNQPSFFEDQSNVIAIMHRCRGVEPHHERRFAINYGLSISESVIVIDSDVRILSPLPPDLKFNPGIAAKSCCSLQKHMQERLKNPSKQKLRKQQIVHQMAEKVGVDMSSPDLKFINEFLFAVTRDQGREQDFLNLWGELAIYADTLGMHRHPTYAMALAAHKTGFPVYKDEMPGLNFFDDRVIKWNIERGKAELTPQIEALFKQQAEIEDGQRSILPRIKRKLRKTMSKRVAIPYNRVRVKLTQAIAPSSLTAYSNADIEKFLRS